MPCDPSDLTVNISPGPSGPAIPGFGNPFAPPSPNFSLPFPTGFPEDLNEIMDLLQLILPSGTIKPALNLNFGKDIFDGIMYLLDKFIPFFMLYKFFLPILELIICIIEVLCAIANPFKLIKALKRLFRICLPDFLALFPIFAVILMLVSLLLLILSLIEFLVNEIIKLVNILLKNIQTIVKALTKHDSSSILNAVKKIGMVLCGFQNLFVLLAVFKVIIDLIKDILKLFFSIPPCDDSDNGNAEKCCTPDVCPSFIKNDNGLTRSTGTLQYFNEASSGVNSLPAGFPAGFPVTFFNSVARAESWQFYDASAAIPDAFWNISSAFDLPTGVTQVFFPTDATYQDGTPPNQVPYTINLRLFYNPASWNRVDVLGPRFLRVNNCIVLKAPTQKLDGYNNSTTTITNGVLELAGGTVTEDDGAEVFIGDSNATLTNFFHLDPEINTSNEVIQLFPTDGYQFSEVTYTFNINYEVLIQKALITLGCMPDVALDRTFVNSVFGGNAGANFTFLNNLVNGTDGNVFPDIAGAQTCLTAALSALRNNISAEGVADFQAMTTICLNKLGSDTTQAINSLIGIGYDQYKSTFTLAPEIQFTSSAIEVQVTLKEMNGQNITSGLPASIAADIAGRITPIATFGSVSDFVYDGYQFFNAQITSQVAGNGTLQVSFDNKIISIANVPTDLTQSPTITPVVLPYTFIYSPLPSTGANRRNETDVSQEGTNSDGG